MTLRLLLILPLLAWTSPRALALPMETANLLGQGFEAHILTIMPQAKFSVDERMKQNVEFWMRIYTLFSTSQGLVHDAKYIDHVYEVVDLPSDPRAYKKLNRQVKEK